MYTHRIDYFTMTCGRTGAGDIIGLQIQLNNYNVPSCSWEVTFLRIEDVSNSEVVVIMNCEHSLTESYDVVRCTQ